MTATMTDAVRRHLEVDSVVCEELCASLVAGQATWPGADHDAQSRITLAGSSGSADASLVEVPPNPFAHLVGNEP